MPLFKRSALGELRHALQELNAELPDSPIAACRLRWDEDFGAPVADILYALPVSDNEPWSMDQLDALCERTSEKLADLVAYSYCDFRSPEGAAAELASRDDPAWNPLDATSNDSPAASTSA